MTVKISMRDLPALLPIKPAGPGGTPSPAPAGMAFGSRSRRPNRQAPAVRPPSLARFPGLSHPEAFIGTGGTAL